MSDRTRRWGGGDQPATGKPIEYGIRSMGTDTSIKRGQVQNVGGSAEGVRCIGPSKIEKRSSAIKSGNSQKKKHKSAGGGQ
jgi:hypothetical protein